MVYRDSDRIDCPNYASSSQNNSSNVLSSALQIGDPYKVRELLLGVILCRPRGFQLQILHDHSSSSNLSWRARISTATIITRNKMRQSGLMQWIVSLPL